MKQRILSLANLAYRFNLHMLAKPFRDRRPGTEQFLERYGPDRLLPLPPELRETLPRLAGCLSCGLCDTVCTKLDTRLRHLVSGPSELASSLTRNLPELELLQDSLEALKQCGDCRACEDICPAGVPLREIVTFAEAVLAGLRELDREVGGGG
jgi:heterodisulfide reductase subunit C